MEVKTLQYSISKIKFQKLNQENNPEKKCEIRNMIICLFINKNVNDTADKESNPTS